MVLIIIAYGALLDNRSERRSFS